MNLKHLIVGAGITAFSLLALAVPEASPAATSAPAAAPKPADNPAAKAKSPKKAVQGKTRGLKSKKGKECITDEGCESGQRK